MDSFVRTVNRIVVFVTRHWLAMVNIAMALVLGLSLLAPFLMLHGITGPGNLLYLVYRPSCHQLPERSFFIGGPQASYTYGELSQHLGDNVPARYVGDSQIGYKMTICERCDAIYAGWLLAGLAFALLRRKLRQLPWLAMVLLALPMVVDGGVQLFGYYESTWPRRVVTGLLFAVGVVWFAFPLIETGMIDAGETARRDLEEMHARDA